MTDDNKIQSALGEEFNPVSKAPTRDEYLRFAMTDAPRGETDAEKLGKAEYLGNVYMDLLRRAQEPTQKDRSDDDCRAEAVYFSDALTGKKDVYGTLWRKNGFKTGAEYLQFMKDFVLKSPEDNKTQALRDFEAMDEKAQEDAAVDANTWTKDNLGHVAGKAMGFFRDIIGPNTTHRANRTEKAMANAELDEAAYRRQIRSKHYADLLAENAWYEISGILPRLSDDGQECAKAVMKSPDNALPEAMYAKFNNLPDNEKQLIVRTRTVLKPYVPGTFLNTIGDMGIGAMNVASAVVTAPYRFGNKLGMMANDDIFDVNEINRKKNYLWEATGKWNAGGIGDGGALPQMQFEQITEDHGIAANALIGAASTVPYMIAAGIPGIGTATVAMEAMNEMDDHVVMQGGDITDPDYVASSALFGALYAYTERLQLEGLLGGASEMKVREAMLKGFFDGVRKQAPIRNLTVGTLSESLQEGLQNGIMSANEALALDQDATKAFASGFAQDFIGSLGTMFIVEGGNLVRVHAKRSGYNNPFSTAGREAGREARSTDLETEYNKVMCEQRMVDYAARSEESKQLAGAIEAAKLVKVWEDGGKDALVRNGLDPVQAGEFDYFFRTMDEQMQVDDEGVEQTDIRGDKARLAIIKYISDKAAEVARNGANDDLKAFDAAMSNLTWVRDAWAQGAGIHRTDEDGNVQDPGAKAIEGLGFSKDVAERLSNYFHRERANAYSPVTLAGIKTRYEAQMAGRVTAKAALAKQFGGNLTRFDGADYLTFDRGNGVLQMVRIDETPGGIDFSRYSEGVAVGVQRETKGEITTKMWYDMSPEERERTWKKYNLINEGYFSPDPVVKVTLAADPSVSVDSTQAAQIIGHIALDSQTRPNTINDTAAAFHEVYHAFSSFAKASGLWTEKDDEYLAKKFGKAKHSQETHDEETAAEGFRSFLARRVNGALTAEDETSPFMKIYAAAAGLDRTAKEKAANEKIADENEKAFFAQLIADENRPKPKPQPVNKPTMQAPEAPQKGIKKEAQAETKPEAQTQTDSDTEDKGQTTKDDGTKVVRTIENPGTWSAYTPTGNVKVSGHWAVLNLEDVIHSNNPLYAIHMRNQLRNRKDNKAEEDTRKEIVNNFQPERLFYAPDTANGAPIVFLDRDENGVMRPFVLSGNGRVLVLNELAERHLYDRYRNRMKQWAADNGIFVPEGQTPILVRVIDDYGGTTREKVADLSNTNSIQQYTEEEQARADAEVIKNLNIARLYIPNADGSADMTEGANDEFFRKFIDGVGDTSLYNSDLSITQAARDRAQRALLAIAVGQGDRGRDVVKKLVEQTETLNIQKQKNAAMIMAAPVASLETNAAYAIGPDVSRAMADFMDYAEKKKAGKVGTFREYLAQMDLIDGPSNIAREILTLLGSDKSAANIAEYVNAYCKAATMEDPSGGLFGKARTRDEIWKDAKRFVEENIGKTTVESADKGQTTKDNVEKTVAEPEVPEVLLPPRDTETITITPHKGDAVTSALPKDPARDGLRRPYDPRKEMPPPSENPIRSIYKDKPAKWEGRGEYWGNKMPIFMGHKKEMFDRTCQTLYEKMSSDERAKFDTVVDYFGGGGCWGMSLALTMMPNVKRIIINEFDPGRARKIELLQTLGKELPKRVQEMFDEGGFTEDIKRRMETAGDDGGESGSGGTLAKVILEHIKPKIGNDMDKLGLMYAFTDCASRQLSGSRDSDEIDEETGEPIKEKITFAERWKNVMERLEQDGRNATRMRNRFEMYGGKVEYVNGDSTKGDFGVGFEIPHGGNVMAVCDPPYYRTTGYSDDGSSWEVGLESTGLGYAYADTEKLLKSLVDSDDGIVYTDEARFYKPKYLEANDARKKDSSLIVSSRTWRREHEILGNIRNMLDHFDVAGKVADRYETLGVHHGGNVNAKQNTNDEETGVDQGSRVPGVGDDGRGHLERGSQDNGDATVQGLAGGTEGKDESGLRSGGDSGSGSGRGVRTEAIVQDLFASIQDAAVEAKVGAVDKSATEDLVRNSIRQVREDKMLAYANAVSKNAAAYLKREAEKLDRYMAEHGYTEKVWHGTEGEDFNVFKLDDKSHEVKAAYFTYKEETASNYATLKSLNNGSENYLLVDDFVDIVKPNIRSFYVNPGKVLDIDESEYKTTFLEFKNIVKKAKENGYNSIRVKNTLDDHGFRLGPGDSLKEYTTVGNAEEGLRTNILIVLDQDGDPGANRIKAADPVTFMMDTEGEMPIPMEWRADQSTPDVRYSVAMGNRAKEEARRMIEKYRPDVGTSTHFVNDEAVPDIDFAVDAIAKFETPKERKAALMWFCKNTVRLPEDAPKVVQAIRTAENSKVDPMQFERPGDILDQFADYKPKGKAIDPDTVPELSDRREMGHGIVTYLVQDDKAGQAAMRRIINTHFGEDASPWCLLQGDGAGGVSLSAWEYWQHYNALPKRVAFKDGKLVAFMATDENPSASNNGADLYNEYEENLTMIGETPIPYEDWVEKNYSSFSYDIPDKWWDRRDESHDGIPFTENDDEGKVEHKELMPNGSVRTFKVTRGDPNVKNGTYEEWDVEGVHLKIDRENNSMVSKIETFDNGIKKTEVYCHNNPNRRIAIHKLRNGNAYEVVAERNSNESSVSFKYLPNFNINKLKLYYYETELDGLNDASVAEDYARKLYDAFEKQDDDLVNKITNELIEKFSTNNERNSIATAWKRDVKATCMTTRANIMSKHADLFDKAKAGDMTSAYKLVKAVVKPEKIDALVKGLPKNTIVVPVSAEEKRGRNKLPRAYAKYIAQQTGLDYAEDIMQSVRAYHTGASAQERLMTSPEFDGTVEKGRSYIIVDDHITQGGTVNAMRDFIESRGGKVVAVSALTLSQGSSILSPQKDTLDELKRKWPDIDKLLRKAGVADRVEGLTESQCRYVKKFSPDTFRTLCAKAGHAGSGQTVRQALVNGPSEEVGSEGQERADIQTEPETPDERHSFFIGRASKDVAHKQDKFYEALKILNREYDGTYSTKARNDVYKRTGWWKGVDGMWRFEIADLKPKKIGKTEGKMVNGLVPYENLPYAKGGMCCNVTEICDAPELFKAYPSLKKTIVRIRDLNKEGIGGSYDVNLGVLELDKRKVKSQNGKPTNVLNADGIGTITHELQHAIQYLEGFAKGGNTQDHGRTNYNKLAGEVEARNVALRTMVGKWDTPWNTEDVKRKNQIIADGYGNMRDYRGHRVERRSIRRADTERDSRRAIAAYKEAEEKKAANNALENYVAYFKLSHGSIPKGRTIARMGLALGMDVVDAGRILKAGDKIAEEMRGTIVEQASQNGDVATAIALIKQKKDAQQKLNDLIASSAKAGGTLTNKGVGQVNYLLQKRVESMMRRFTAATLADMEGDTGLDIAAEILANNPDAFETEYRKAKGEQKKDDENIDDETNEQTTGVNASVGDEELSDADKFKREQMQRQQAARVTKFIEDAKNRALLNEQRAKERRAKQLEGSAEKAGTGTDETPETAPKHWNMKVEPAKANFKTPEEFASFLRVWAADRFAKTHGHQTLAKAQQDKLFGEFYRICARKELQDLADKLLAPKMLNDAGEMVPNAKLAKLGAGARVWVNRRLADMEKGIRPDTIERMSADIFAFINKAAVRVSRVDLITSFKDALKKKYLEGKDFEELKADTERKLTGWVEEATRYIAYVCDLSRRSVNGDPSELEKEYKRLHEIIDRRARIYDESGADVTDAANEDADTRRAQWKLALLDKYGAMRSLMPGQILDLQNDAFDYLDNEAKKLEERWAETRKEQEMVRHDLAHAIVGPKDQRYDAGKGAWGWVNKTLLDSMNGMLRLRLEHLTRFASAENREKAKDAINSIIVMLGRGETEYALALQRDREMFFEGLGEIFRTPDGKADNKAIKRYLERMDETIPTELSEKLSNQGFAYSMTYGQMLQLLVSLEQGSFKDTVEANGREGQADLIRSFKFRNEKGEVEYAFTAQDDAFVRWLRGFYAAKRDVLSQVTERMVGQKVDSPDPLYCPIRRFIDDKARDLHSDPTQRWDPISKIFSRRVPSTRDFDESRTIVGLFFENSKESAKLTAWAERGSFIRNVVTSPVFQAQVKRAFGPGELSKILKQLEATFNGGEQRSQTPGEVAAADKAVNFVTYAYLGFNPLSALKQTTSFTVWANVLPNGFADLWRHMTHVDKDVIKHIMESDEYKIRYGNKVGSGMDYATKGLNMNPNDNPIVRGIRGAGMWMLQRGDFAPGAWIAQGLYKDLLNKHLNEGMDNEAADKLAMTETFNLLEECQQSARTYNTNMLQVEHGRIGRMLTQFATSPLQQLQYETQALREWIDMVRFQMGDEKIAEARAKFRRAVVINHVLIPAAMNIVIAMYKAALGEEPPWEKDGYHWTLLIDLLMGQFSRVFFLGAFAQTTLEALLKREYPRTSQMLPIEGALGMAASGAFMVRDLATMDVDKLQNDLERAMKSTAPTRIPYNLTRRFLGDSDVDRKRKKKK